MNAVVKISYYIRCVVANILMHVVRFYQNNQVIFLLILLLVDIARQSLTCLQISLVYLFELVTSVNMNYYYFTITTNDHNDNERMNDDTNS